MQLEKSFGLAWTAPISADVEAELLRRFQAGDSSAGDEFVRLYQSLPKRYAARHARKWTVPSDDAVSVCHVGLVKAMLRFRVASNTRFATYATWCMHNELRFEAVRSRLVRPNYHAVWDGRRVHCGLPSTRSSPKMIEAAEATLAVASLGPADEQRYAVEDTAIAAVDNRDEVRARLDVLDPWDADIVRRYYGLDGGRPMSIRELGELLNVNRVTVHKTIRRAQRRMAS